MPSCNLLQRLDRLNRSSFEFHDQLCNVLYGEEYMQSVPKLQNDDLVWLVDYLDKVRCCAVLTNPSLRPAQTLGSLNPSGPSFRKCLRELRKICGTKMILPISYILSSPLLNIDRQLSVSGGFSDIYKGSLDGSTVCVKRIRVYSQEGPERVTKVFSRPNYFLCNVADERQAFCQEAVMWKYLDHPNIVPLLGVTFTPLQLISEWMPDGDLAEWIKKHPSADRLSLVGVPPAVFDPILIPPPAIRCRRRTLLSPLPSRSPRRSPGGTWLFRKLFRH